MATAITYSNVGHAQVSRTGWAAPVEVPSVRVEIRGYYAGLALTLTWANNWVLQYRINVQSHHVSPGAVDVDLALELEPLYDVLALDLARQALEENARDLAQAYREVEAQARTNRVAVTAAMEADAFAEVLGTAWEHAWHSTPGGLGQ